MTDDAFSTLMSRLIRRLNGLRIKCSKPFPFDTAPKYLLRDRDRIYGHEFRKQVDIMGIKEVLSAPRSPWQRAYVERVIGSIRRECLDHVIVFDEDSLRRRYAHISRITIAHASISLWIKIRQTHGLSNRSVESLHVAKLVGCTIATSASRNYFPLHFSLNQQRSLAPVPIRTAGASAN